MSKNPDNDLSTQEIRRQLSDLRIGQDSGPSSSSSIPNIVDAALSREIAPNSNLIAAMPAISGENFFSRPTGDNHNLSINTAYFPRNSLQSYKAPSVSELPWPPNASEAHKMDKTLQNIQEHLAHITRPIDSFAATVFTSTVDDAIKSEVLGFLQVMRSQIADVAHIISDERQERCSRTHPIKAKRDEQSRDFLFIKNFMNERKGRMNWNECFLVGSSQGLFQGYKASKSLKNSYNKGKGILE